MNFFEYPRWRMTSVFGVLCPSIVQKLAKHVIKNLTTDITVTSKLLTKKNILHATLL